MKKNLIQKPFANLLGSILLVCFSAFPMHIVWGQCPPGNVNLTTQAQVNAFAAAYPNCTTINGSLTIGSSSPPSNISDISGLQNITTVTESVEIGSTYDLTTLNGLNNLTTIGSNLRIRGCLGLTSLEGLNSVSSVPGDLVVQLNENLASLNGLNSLSYVGQGIYIQWNLVLSSLEGLNNLSSASGWEIRIEYNDALTSLDALNNLTSIGGCRLIITNNPSLQSIQGLENIDPTSIDILSIGGHPLLSYCAIQSICERITDPNNPATVSICCNATGCNSEQEVEALCDTPPTGCTNAFQWPQFAYPLNNNSAPITISDCTWEGDYSEIPDAVAGMTLQFTSTAPNGIITIRSGTPDGPVIAFGPLPLTFDNTFTGPIYAHWNLPNCETGYICRTTTVQCLNCDPPLPNDVCEGAIPIICGGVVTGVTYGARVDFPGIPSCGNSNFFPAQGVWYSFVGTGSLQIISLQTTEFNPKINVYEGNCGSLNCAFTNGSGNQVTVSTTLGTTYYVLVYGSFIPEYGTFTIQLLDETPPIPTCKNYSVFLGANGTANVSPNDVFQSGIDNCGGITPVSVYPSSFNCSNVGENTVTLFVIDDSGNGATCTSIVDVEQYPFEVNLPTCKTVYYGYEPASCASISSSVSGGYPPFTYQWSSGQTSADIQYCATSSTPPPPFSLIVTDANGCNVSSGTSTVVEVIDVTCGNNNDKVLVCHVLNNGNSNTLCLAENPAAIHLAHGDALGECGIQVCEPYQPVNNQIQGPTGPHHHVADAERLLVYPNPAGREVTIVMEPNSLVTQLAIENALGVRVLLEKVSPDTERHIIDVSDLPPGLYFISTEGKLPVQFVKQ